MLLEETLMPKAIYSIWWDVALGPLLGRSYPENDPLTSEDAIVIFMGHGVSQEAKVGYTKLSKGLVVSYLESPNCIAVLLDENDEPSVIERNLLRLVSRINFNSSTWDTEITRAFLLLQELIAETSGKELLSNTHVMRLVQDMESGRLSALVPKHILKATVRYPKASEYLGTDEDEVWRLLKDLERAGRLIPKTYGRRVECRQCGGAEVTFDLACPSCGSEDIYKVYLVLCPKCGNRTQTVIVDDLAEIRCQQCKQPAKVSELTIIDVELLCKGCGQTTKDPRIVLSCANCGKRMTNTDLLGATGLAYYPAGTKRAKSK
jgi:ribosomal protein S27E